jgi:hypothetical protein
MKQSSVLLLLLLPPQVLWHLLLLTPRALTLMVAQCTQCTSHCDKHAAAAAAAVLLLLLLLLLQVWCHLLQLTPRGPTLT